MKKTRAHFYSRSVYDDMNTKNTKIISICILLILSINSESRTPGGFKVAYPMGLTGEINCTVMQLPDVFLGGSFYYPISAYHGLSCYGSFAMRAGRRTVLEKTGPAEYTQFKELRLLWDVGLDESISFSNKTGLYARGGLGFSHRWCKGSNAGTSITPTPALQAGAFVVFDSEYRYRLRLGYNFAKAGTSGPHGVILSFQFGGLL